MTNSTVVYHAGADDIAITQWNNDEGACITYVIAVNGNVIHGMPPAPEPVTEVVPDAHPDIIFTPEPPS